MREGRVLFLGLAALLLYSACASGPVDSPRAVAPDSGGEPSATAADWCVEHGLPESKCTKCNPELVAKYKAAGDWCAEHSLPESACPVCNPVPPPPTATPAIATAADWCVEHGLPESKCTKCNPELVAQYKASGDWCAEHSLPESVCPICNSVPPPPGVVSPTVAPGTRIRFRSPEIESASGIAMEPARSASLDRGVECIARIEFDRNRLADIRATVPGVVREVGIDLGQHVERGTVLFVLESAEISGLQGQLRAAREHLEIARANYERQLRLLDLKIVSTRDVELAREELETEEAELRTAEAGLRVSGATEADLAGTFRERSPIAGTVVRRPATIGTFATSEVSLATIADTSRMWAMLDVPEADAGPLGVGQPVTIRVDGLPGHEFAGVLTWIASEVDSRTRTVSARAEMDNEEGLLRAEQFARAIVRVAASETALVVPHRAVQRVGEESVVFVRMGVGLYEPRIVYLGRPDHDRVEVRGALREGESVVTEGAFLLRTELSRENLGAGCCEVVPPGGS